MTRPIRFSALLAALTLLFVPLAAQSAEDAGALVPQFAEGDVISMETINKLKPFLPDEFWDNRDFFFYEGMKLEIGPTMYDYSAPEVYTNATERFERGNQTCHGSA